MGSNYIFVVLRRQGCANRLKELWGLSYSIERILGAYGLSLNGDVAWRRHPQPRGTRLAP